MAMSRLSPLVERLMQLPGVVRVEGYRVSSGSPARYRLRPETGFMMSVSAARVLTRRHVRIAVAKEAVEHLLVREDATVDVPMVEDIEVFERELAELGVRAERIEAGLAIAAARSGRQ
jgi:hypothetical protein